MIDRLDTVCIFVNDQDRAKQFYTRVLGFELHSDQPMGPGTTARWIAVAPPGAVTEVILYLMDDNWTHYRPVMGQSQALTFAVKDMAGLVKDLKGKGVVFEQEPDVQPWGTYATIQDSEGNRLLLVEHPHS